MKLGYTEFSFGYAFTENLIRAAPSGPDGAPFFPNLIQEAQLGYDVHIDLPGFPLYFQYKLPELMVRKSASEISRWHLPGISKPFFRMYLMKRNLSRQHELLIDLENRSPNAVYYATSLLQNAHEFNAAYRCAAVHRHSVFFSPKQIGLLPDDKQHVIAFPSGLNKAWLCSEPREISALRFENISAQLRESLNDPRYSTLREVGRNLREEMRTVLQQADSKVTTLWSEDFELTSLQIEDIVQHRINQRGVEFDIDSSTTQVVEDLLISREIARVLFGVDLIIAQASSQQ